MRPHSIIAVCAFTLTGAASLPSQTTSALPMAPEGAEMRKVWHLGRVTGDLERIVQFYHDLLGLELRGARDQALPFYTVDAINEFVNGPKGAEFRAVNFPIQGASDAETPTAQVYLEAFEYRNINRRLIIPALSDLGVSSLRFIVRDMDQAIADAKAANAAFITNGAEPVRVSPPPGLSGATRAVMLRDPDGYPVELVEVTPDPQTFAPPGSKILGAQMSLVVEDVEASLDLYRRFTGAELPATVSPWRKSTDLSRVRNIDEAEARSASFVLPGSAVRLELIQFRGIGQQPYRPVFQDIGFGHIAFNAVNIETTLDRMRELNMKTLSPSGTWTQVGGNLRAVYTRDRDGFFLEIIERK